MKQTSIEWLQAEFNKWAEGRVFIPQDLLEEAKRLEKEQIIEAYENGVGDENERNLSGQFTNAENYYNQTYNN